MILPFSLVPKPRQLAAVEFAIKNKRCLLNHPMRAGKTLSALMLAATLLSPDAIALYQTDQIKRVLVICTQVSCEHVWMRTMRAQYPQLIGAWCYGTPLKKKNIATDSNIQIVVINYESLASIEPFCKGMFDLIIVDEATKVKNHRTKTWKALNNLSINKRLVLMTGTPVPQKPSEAYGMIRLINSFYISYTDFRESVEQQVTMFTWRVRPDAAETVAKWLVPAHVVKKEDCYDDSGIKTIEMSYDLTSDQSIFIKNLKKEMLVKLGEQEITAINSATLLSKLLQVQTGFVYPDAGPVVNFDASGLYNTIKDLLEQTDKPSLIFTPFIQSTKNIAVMLEIDYPGQIGIVHKDIPLPDRQVLFDRVQAGTIKALVAIPKTMSHAVTLFNAETIIWTAPEFSNEIFTQANGRIIKPEGQTIAGVYLLSAGKISDRLFGVSQARSDLQKTLLDIMHDMQFNPQLT